MQSIFKMWEETFIPDVGGTFQTAFTPGVGIPDHRPGIPMNESTLFLRVMNTITYEDLSIASLFGSPRSSESHIARLSPTDIHLCSEEPAETPTQSKTTISSLLHGMG